MNEEIKRIDEIEQLLNKDTYDDYVKAIDLIQKELARLEAEKQKELKRIEEERQKEEARIREERQKELKRIEEEKQKEEARIREERQKKLKRIEKEIRKEEARIGRVRKITAYVAFYISLVLIFIGIVALFDTGHWFWGILVIIGFLYYAILVNMVLYYWRPTGKEITWENMEPNTKLKLIVIGIIIAIILLIFMCSVE